MLYELRIYEILPGKMPVIDARFREHTLGFFERHGVEVVGFWHEVVGRSDRLVYLTRFADMADRERKWGAFISDPRVAATSRRHGVRRADRGPDPQPVPRADGLFAAAVGRAGGDERSRAPIGGARGECSVWLQVGQLVLD